MRQFILLTALLLAGCTQPRERQSEDLKTFDTAEPAMRDNGPQPLSPPAPVTINREASASTDQDGGPNISVSAAPGVAFNYRYAFRLPNARIASAQEAHALMCERLGITRCRITGMRYSLVNERDVTASLELKLDPAIARSFGKNATRVVIDSEGMLVDQQINGIDAGASIERANRGRAELQDELDLVNRELARPGLSSVVRDRLLSEAQSIRLRIAALGEQKKADEESLATTPMAFYYGSGDAIPGFDEATPLGDAVQQAGYILLSTLGFLIVAFAAVLPWLLLASLAFWAYRRNRHRWPVFDSYRESKAYPSEAGASPRSTRDKA